MQKYVLLISTASILFHTEISSFLQVTGYFTAILNFMWNLAWQLFSKWVNTMNSRLLRKPSLDATITCHRKKRLNKQTTWKMTFKPLTALFHTGGPSDHLQHPWYLFPQILLFCYCSVQLFGDQICPTDSFSCEATSFHKIYKQMM